MILPSSAGLELVLITSRHGTKGTSPARGHCPFPWQKMLLRTDVMGGGFGGSSPRYKPSCAEFSL